MMYDETRAPDGRAGASAVPEAKRSLMPMLSVVAVAVVIVLLVGYASVGVLTPTREVRVSPVIGTGGVIVETGDGPAGSSGRRFSAGGGETVQAPGWLEADPFYVAATALADGVLEEVLVLEGESVEAGQVVARMVRDDAELALARAEAELASARAQRVEAIAERDAAQREWDHPVERERAVLSARAARAEVDADLERLPALIRAERAMLERMEEDLSRLTSAEASEAATRFEVIVREKDVDRQAAILRATEQRERVLAARRDLLSSELRAAERDYELRIDERRRVDGSVAAVMRADALVAEHEARVGEARLRLDRMTIRAPISGLVQERIKVAGDKVMLAMDDRESAHVLHLYDPSMLQVRVDVPLADAARVRVEQRCEVVVDVLPDRVFGGEVTRITHEADLQKNTLEVKVRVVDPAPILKPEMLTRVKFIGGTATENPPETISEAASARGTVLVTGGALRDRDGASAEVFVVRDRREGRGVADGVGVEIVEERGDGYARVRPVGGVLQPGDLLVVGDADVARGDRVSFLGMEGGGA